MWGVQNMINTKKLRIGIGIIVMILLINTVMVSASDNTTTLEIVDISGGFGGVAVSVQNIGENTATRIAVVTTVNGGLFNAIDIAHSCTGCSACGSTLEPQDIKVENTMEAGFLMGFGPIKISTVSYADNADEVSAEATGLVIGPLVIIH